MEEIAYFFVGGQAELSCSIADLPVGLALQGTLLRNGQTYPMLNSVSGSTLTLRTSENPVLPAGKYTFVLTMYKTSNDEIVDEETAEITFRTPKTPVR